MNLADYYLFERLAEGKGGRTALRFGDLSWSYSEVADRSRKMVALLQERGLQHGDRVYLILPDVPPFAWAFCGAL